MSQPQPDRYYNPSHIAAQGWIKNTQNKNDYHYVLRLIKDKKLRARNICLTGSTYYQVLGADILRFRG